MSALLWVVSVMFLVDGCKAAPAPYITMDPDWRTIFRGEQTSLICNVHSTGWIQEDFQWYKDDQPLHINRQTMQINNAIETYSGEYRCKTASSDRSDPVRLEVRNDWVILQVPSHTYEGDVLALNCRGWDSWFKNKVTFYLDGRIIQDKAYYMDETRSGTYTCKRERFITTYESKEVHVQVQGLFSFPVVKLAQPVVSEGDDMTVTCDTALSAARRATVLLFAFYRNEQKVREFTQNNEYKVLSAQLGHAGKYYCEVKTLAGTVRKRSNGLYIQVQGPSDNAAGWKEDSESSVGADQPCLTLLPSKAAVGDVIVLHCESPKDPPPTHFRFYHNGTILRNVTVNQKRSVEIRQIISAVTMTGPYYCGSRYSASSVIWISEKVHLFIIEPVANVSITTEKDDDGFVFGEPVTLTCSVQQGTSPSYLWFHNETVVEEGSTFYQLRDNQKRLYIDSLQSHHRGTYRCNASNKLPPNRTFSALSAPRNINVLEPSPAEILLTESQAQYIAPGVVLLVILLTAALSFTYRQKVLRRGPLYQPKTERTRGQESNPQNPTTDITESSRDIDQQDYSNIPSRVNVVCDDVCYAYVDIKRVRDASLHPNKGDDEFSVTYSAVRFSPSATDLRTTQETPNCTDIYQNFNANRRPS